MNRVYDGRVLTCVLLMGASIGMSGCTSVHRNLADVIVVTAAPSLAESETKIALELRDAREELRLSESDAFLKSDRAAKLSLVMRCQLRDRCESLRRTMDQARKDMQGGVAVVRPDPARALADGNLVVYVAGKSDVRVLFSRDEIAQLIALRECADDLATIRYTHPGFDPERLRALRDRLAALELKVDGISLSGPEVERLKAEAATRVLDRCLREGGVALPDGSPLLTTGWLASMRSPKLTAALKDPSVVERVLKNQDPNAVRALLFLVNRDVVELAYP